MDNHLQEGKNYLGAGFKELAEIHILISIAESLREMCDANPDVQRRRRDQARERAERIARDVRR